MRSSRCFEVSEASRLVKHHLVTPLTTRGASCRSGVFLGSWARPKTAPGATRRPLLVVPSTITSDLRTGEAPVVVFGGMWLAALLVDLLSALLTTHLG